MKVLSVLAAGAAAFLALASAPAASAAFYEIVKGQIKDGFDYAGDFGAVGALSGRYVAVYEFDTSLGHDLFGPFEERADGGPGSGFANPVLKATLTINGVTVTYPGPGGSNGTVDTFNLTPIGGAAAVSGLAQSLLPNISATLLNSVGTADAPTRLNTEYVGAALPNDQTVGLANWDDVDSGGAHTTRFTMSFTPGQVILTADPAAALPEPGTWALMIVGFGGVGSALRGRAGRRADVASK
jgi:hypothetical protein